mmetsp:Transcript_12269/g.36449  ORF Transcript_12269/g.36449 Transcript_12269/m.36449 type:complete len:342 (+) Transcript_12269:6069-7094(+)
MSKVLVHEVFTSTVPKSSGVSCGLGWISHSTAKVSAFTPTLPASCQPLKPWSSRTFSLRLHSKVAGRVARKPMRTSRSSRGARVPIIGSTMNSAGICRGASGLSGFVPFDTVPSASTTFTWSQTSCHFTGSDESFLIFTRWSSALMFCIRRPKSTASASMDAHGTSPSAQTFQTTGSGLCSTRATSLSSKTPLSGGKHQTFTSACSPTSRRNSAGSMMKGAGPSAGAAGAVFEGVFAGTSPSSSGIRVWSRTSNSPPMEARPSLMLDGKSESFVSLMTSAWRMMRGLMAGTSTTSASRLSSSAAASGSPLAEPPSAPSSASGGGGGSLASASRPARSGPKS